MEYQPALPMGLPDTSSTKQTLQFPTKLIGLCAGRMGSGKTEVARYLQKHKRFEIVSFASPIKRMVSSLLDTAGVEVAQIDRLIYGDLKETPQDIFGGKSPRYVMQTLGSEWGRQLIDKHLWTNISTRKIQSLMRQGINVVVDDLRFPNELELIRNLGGFVAYVDRPWADEEVLKGLSHASEGQIRPLDADCIIDNNRSLNALYNEIDLMVSDINTKSN